jgi:hypothetical protein
MEPINKEEEETTPKQPPTPEQIEYIKKKERALRVKCICLFNAGLSLFTNVSNLKTKDKKKLIAQITKMFEEGDDDEIVRKFNEATETLWADGSGEYINSPIYNNGICYFD